MSIWEKLKKLLELILSLFKKKDSLTKVSSTIIPVNTIKIVTAGSSCGFEPSSLRVGSGVRVTFKNETGNIVELFFSNRDIFDLVSLFLEPDEAVTLLVKDGEGGEVHISVDCNTHSMIEPMTVAPTIIVNRD